MKTDKNLSLTGHDIDKIIKNVLYFLSMEKERINNLNVFPVPDGDTGLNMTLTIQGALDSLRNFDIETLSAEDYLKRFSEGIVFNSRGCSGVILALYSQGLVESLLANGLSHNSIRVALQNGYEKAFKETINPKEGTILTLMRVLYERFNEIAAEEGSKPVQTLRKTIPFLREALDRTPEMLPILKEAGVVDSGAMGFLVIIEGIAIELEDKGLSKSQLMTVAHTLLINKYIRYLILKKRLRKKNRLLKTVISNVSLKNINNISLLGTLQLFNNFLKDIGNENIVKQILKRSDELQSSWNPAIENKYCTEFVLESDRIVRQDLEKELERFGDSLLLISFKKGYKVHIHTNNPKLVLTTCTKWGKITSSKIDNMKKQHRNLVCDDKTAYAKENAILVIVNGKGFAEILKGLGATNALVYGKVKPSVKDIQKALDRTRAKNIIVAADDSDISMALNSAITLSKSNVELIPTKDIISVISIMYAHSSAYDIIQNAREMRNNLNNIKFIKISKSTRDFSQNGQTVDKSDFFALYKKQIIFSSLLLEETITHSIDIVRDDATLVTLYGGKMEKNREKLLNILRKEFTDIDFELYEGGQDRYNYYITFE
jgi:dihydroxyacetone kinase-like predicted kinase